MHREGVLMNALMAYEYLERNMYHAPRNGKWWLAHMHTSLACHEVERSTIYLGAHVSIQWPNLTMVTIKRNHGDGQNCFVTVLLLTFGP